MTLQDIIANAKEKAEADAQSIYFAGVEEGRRLAKIEILNLLISGGGEDILNIARTARDGDPLQPANSNRQSEDARTKRAPRGLTTEVLKLVFNANPDGLTMSEAQDAAVAIDERVSKKTVYNEMYRETDTYFKDDNGVWHLRSQGRGGNAAWFTSQGERSHDLASP